MTLVHLFLPLSMDNNQGIQYLQFPCKMLVNHANAYQVAVVEIMNHCVSNIRLGEIKIRHIHVQTYNMIVMLLGFTMSQGYL